MSFEEFKKTDAVIRAKLTKKFGKQIAATEEEMKMIFDTYDGVSEGEGVTKADWFKIEAIENRMNKRIMRAMRRKHRKNRRGDDGDSDSDSDSDDDHMDSDDTDSDSDSD